MAADITEVRPVGAQLDAAVPARSRHLGLALVVISMAQLMLVLDELIVNTALPHIQQALHFSGTGLEWVVTGYAVTFGGLLMLGGRAGDILGRRRMFSAGILFFTLASLLGGFATNSWLLITARVLQGAGAALAAPAGLSLIAVTFPEGKLRTRALGMYAAMTGLGGGVGVVAGGLLTTYASWRWVFFVNVPIGVAALAFGAVFLDQVPQNRPGRFDLAGFLLSGIGLGLLMYGVSEGPGHGWGAAQVLASVAAGAVLLAVMVVVELRTTEPIVALRLLGNRLFRSANGVMILTSIAFLGSLYVISLYYQDGRGLSPLASGLSTFPEAIGVMLGAQLASRVLYPRLGPRRHITLGLLGVSVSIGLLALLGAGTSLWWARLLMFTLGLAMGQVFVPAQAAAFATISSEATGRASTMFNAVRQLGGAIGVALLTTVIVLVGATHRVAGHEVANLASYRITFLVAAVVCLLAVGASLSIHDADAAATIVPPRRRRRAVEPEAAVLGSAEPA
jgi:EmrB/QacA subfamily drug resistance transporter